jgi:hypothetical protein
MTAYILFLGFTLIGIAVFLWALRKGISNIQNFPGFTDLEATAIRRQMLALLGVPLFILFFVLSPLAWHEFPPYALFIGLIIGFAPVGYIAVSSIRNRVSIFRGREPLPVKGTKAVWNGVMNLVLIFLVFMGYALYFASFK